MDKLAKKLMEENENAQASDFFSPEAFAWKMILDDTGNVDDLSGVIQTFTPETDLETDPASYLFEILLTIYMEMIFQLFILTEASNSSEDKPFDPTPKFDNFNIDYFMPTIEEKFRKVSILAYTEKYDRKSDVDMTDMINQRYCRIIFRHLEETKAEFRKLNKMGVITSDTNYHMKLNELYNPTAKLRDIYAIVMINDICYKIYFNTVQKLGSASCSAGLRAI